MLDNYGKNTKKIYWLSLKASHVYMALCGTFYLLGIKNEKPPKREMTAVTIPAANFAIATVPNNMDTIEAWTQYFEKELPLLGYIPDAEHGRYFEFYNANEKCELWTPVKKQNE